MADLSLRHIDKIYDNNVQAVFDFNLEIKDKEFIVFVGPSGCGKSTTLRMIAGLEDISAGEFYIDDKLMNDVEPKDRDIAMVFQSYALYPHMSVYDNMAFGLKLKKTPKEEIDKRVREAARILEIEDYLDRKPKALSGGQRQRVALGRAIVRNAKVFLMDEPLSNLDAQLRTEMREEIARLHREIGMTLIYVTHDQVEAMTMGDRILVLDDEKIQQLGTPLDLYNHPANEFVAKFIGSPEMNLMPITINDDGDRFSIGDTFWTDNAFVLPFDLPAGSYHLGIRPEKLVPVSIANPDTITAKVKSLQQLGNDTMIFCDFDGQTLVSRVPEQFTIAVGADLNLLLPANADEWHLFDSNNGVRITAAAPAREAVEYGA